MKKATAAKERMGKAIETAIQEIFMQYSTLLLEEARHPWSKFFGEQIDCEPWTDAFGVQQLNK